MSTEAAEFQRHPPAHKDLNLYVIASITLMAVMGISSIAPVFPQIVAHFGITEQEVGWLITIFTLPGIILNPLTGIMADRFGRKNILVPLLLLFAFAGVACAFTHTFTQLLVFRFFQGIGGSSLGPINAAVVGDIYKGKKRTAVMGYIGMAISLGAAAYPAIGGGLATIGWYVPFLLPLLAFPVTLLVIKGLDNPEPSGMINWKSYFLKILSSFKNKQAIGLFILTVLTFILLFGPYINYLPFLLKEKFQISTLMIGLVLSTMSIVTAAMASQLGRLVHYVSERQMLIFGYTCYAIALGWMPFIDSFLLFFLPVLLFGIGHGLNLPNILSLLTNIAPMEQRAAFMSINGMVLRIGQTIAPTLAGLIFTFGGLYITFFYGTLLAVLMLFFSFLLLSKSSS